MRNGSHTFIGHLRDAIEAWRKANGWSRETAVMNIVDAHEQIDGPSITGIVFAPPSRDTFERAKANADRVFRWIDDVTKDNNTVPANFIPSILAALPLSLRMELANRWLAPLGIACRPIQHDAADDSTLCVFKSLVKNSSTAQASVADMLDGIDPGELERAHAALCEAQISIQDALSLAERKMVEAQSEVMA